MVPMVLNPNTKVCIIGLGYVGLPLATAFAKKYHTTGFDIDPSRVEELQNQLDRTETISPERLNGLLVSGQLTFTTQIESIQNCDVFIVTVPTPVTADKEPDLLPLKAACQLLGKILKPKQIVIFESTVYPGCTEEICVPILESTSKLQYNNDFFCGYSPERINPGDQTNTIENIVKVTSGSTPETAQFVDEIYQSVITAGTHKAPSIKVAEASKAIENAQRDVNISFINELSLIFDKMNIDTYDVLAAAATKWNFLSFKPGLVGGHCIGVDPFYLAYQAKKLGYDPKVILSGRHVNDKMGVFAANKMAKLLHAKGKQIQNASIVLLGITFKENCTDVRNSKVVDVYSELTGLGVKVSVYDPNADPILVKQLYNIELIDSLTQYDGIMITVGHQAFFKLDYNKLKLDESSVIYDLKAILPREMVDARL
jgi:UDP-N-acetyl-D-galactosamine dehydrogenase